MDGGGVGSCGGQNVPNWQLSRKIAIPRDAANKFCINFSVVFCKVSVLSEAVIM